MKRCVNCGIIVHDNFETYPYCKSVNFTKESEVAKADYRGENAISRDSENQTPEIKYAVGYDSKMHGFKALEVMGSVLALIGIFLPFIRVSFLGTVMERTFQDLAPLDFLIFAALAGAGIVTGIIGLHVTTALIGLTYGVALFVETYDYFAEIYGSELSVFVAKGIGFYCMIAGIMLMIIFGIISKICKHEKIQEMI